ncbi:TetR/AcrR family transcriptional regulator [Allokutzneria oryzae]|uniref:TetR/AcrR family transcriptional regulator n=1 Tax=Allokutzneria oryzae TaxID=1378989 RepID=A0ABV5ZNC1_9PSEU
MAVTSADRGREVRRRLADSAAELIAELGWSGVSTRVLAERAGVTPGLVHYHFPSLQVLLAEAAVGAIQRLADGLGGLLERARTPEDAVDVLLGALSEYSGTDPLSLLITETFLATTRDDDLRTAVSTVITGFRRTLATWLADRGAPTPEATAAVLAAAVDGLMLHRALLPEPTAEVVAPVLRRLVAVRP